MGESVCVSVFAQQRLLESEASLLQKLHPIKFSSEEIFSRELEEHPFFLLSKISRIFLKN